MNILDGIFVGEIIQDFGVIKDESYGIGRIRKSALLAKKNGKLNFVIKTSSVAFLGASVRYTEFGLEDSFKIRQFIDQSEAIAKSTPYSEHFSPNGYERKLPASNIILNLGVFLLGSLIIWSLKYQVFTLIATLALFALQISTYQEFKKFEDAQAWQKAIPAFLAMMSFLIGIVKFMMLR